MRSPKMTIILFPLILTLVLSCAQKVEDQTSPGIYLSILGFNEEINQKKLQKLTGDSQLNFEDFIDGLETASGTLLYYSIDEALKYLESDDYPIPEELSGISIITFTDGLDQSSAFVSDEYSTSAEYLAALDTKLEQDIHGVPVSAYTIGYYGQDIAPAQYAEFDTVLTTLSNSRGAAFQASDITSLEAKFTQMADSLNIVSYTQNLNLTIPGNDNGKLVRFTFDGAATADSSTAYIEGTFTISGKTYSLTNLSYHGLTSTSGTAVTGTLISAARITFPFNNVSLDSGNLISLDAIKQYWYSTSWVQNTEFNPNEDTETESVQSSAIVLLVMDCSSSLGSDFDNLKINVYSFVNTLLRDYLTN